MNLLDGVERIKQEGYSEANAEAKLCQDIVIKAIAKSTFRRNVTIKGGVVMRSLSGDVRRATQDLDLDFIRISISEDSIKVFVEKLNCLDVCFQEDSVSVLINSKAQMITEKLKSMMRFGTRSTRYKDVFDICYLSDSVDMEKLRTCIKKYIFMDKTIDVSDFDEIKKRAVQIFSSSTYKEQVKRSKKNWLDLSIDEVLKKDLEFIRKI